MFKVTFSKSVTKGQVYLLGESYDLSSEYVDFFISEFDQNIFTEKIEIEKSKAKKEK